MNKSKLLHTLIEMGVLQQGHFQLTSGLHSKQYIQCAKLFEYPQQAAEVLNDFLPRLAQGTETIAAPAIGGITVGYELARLLGCRFVFAERRDGKMAFRRGFALAPGEKVLVVEDVVTTGGSMQEVVDLARRCGAKVLGVAAVVDRSGGRSKVDLPVTSLLSLEIEVYKPADCPLCAKGIALDQPGSRN